MGQPFQQIITTDQVLQLIQSNVNNALTPLQANPMTGGVLLKKIALISGQDNLIQHTLGRTPAIFFIGNLDSNSTVWSPASPSLGGTNSSATLINFRCSSNCSIAVWIN